MLLFGLGLRVCRCGRCGLIFRELSHSDYRMLDYQYAVVKDVAALHVAIGDGAKDGRWSCFQRTIIAWDANLLMYFHEKERVKQTPCLDRSVF